MPYREWPAVFYITHLPFYCLPPSKIAVELECRVQDAFGVIDLKDGCNSLLSSWMQLVPLIDQECARARSYEPQIIGLLRYTGRLLASWQYLEQILSLLLYNCHWNSILFILFWIHICIAYQGMISVVYSTIAKYQKYFYVVSFTILSPIEKNTLLAHFI